MNATQKRKVSALILERVRAADPTLHRAHRGTAMNLELLDLTLEVLARNGFETVVRHRSRQGERYYNRSLRSDQRVGEARFKYDPAPKDNQGKIHLNLLQFYRDWEPNDQRCWKQVWVRLDKDEALKMLVLGHLP